MAPRITVCMPVHNGEPYLREAIESILNQTFGDWELLVMLDGCTDKSLDIVKSFSDPRIAIVENERRVHAVAVNQGIDMARGEFWAIMDSDDISLPRRLEAQFNLLQSNPALGGCGVWVRTIGDDPGHVWQYPTEPEQIASCLLFEMPLAHPSVMVRTSLLRQHTLRYLADFTFADDWEFIQRASQAFPFSNVPEILFLYRLRFTSLSRSAPASSARELRKIDITRLRELGISPAERELDVHRGLALSREPVDKRFVVDADVWLQRLLSSNNVASVYPEKGFERFIGRRWFNCCTRAAVQGIWSWRQFWNSPLAAKSNLALIEQGKFFVKCLLKFAPRR
jgi:glycosyltransferase involved in cell wall biosynthesis